MSSFRSLIQEAAGSSRGRMRAAARLMSLAEDEPERVFELIGALAFAPEPRIILGITGAPGAGKSLLVDRLVGSLRDRYPERRVGVVAVDPSSPYSRGALLGDRIRMMRHATDPNVFIRSAATRGHLGGLTMGVLGILRVMGLLGCDVVLLETVGVGQSEIEIDTLADLVIVVLAPGQGDTVQFLKSGLMEAGDLFVVNKSDLPEAMPFHAQLTATLRMLEQEQAAALKDQVTLVSARNGDGIEVLLDVIEDCYASEHRSWLQHRQQALEAHVEQAILEQASSRFRQMLASCMESDPFGRILRGEVTLDQVVGRLMRQAARIDRCGGCDDYRT